MSKLFVYEVNGENFEDTVAFGDAWHKAKEVAVRKHVGIFRTVVRGDDISYEFYANGCVFLNERFFAPEKLYIF